MRHQMFLALVLIFSLIGSIRTYSDSKDDMSFLHVNVKNEGASKIEGLKVRIFIYDLDALLQTNPFDLDNGDSTGKLIFWDAPYVAPGTYLVRITVSNDDFREVKHRFVTIA